MKFELFSQREARKKGQYPPAPSSKSFSKHLRRNLVDIFREALGIYQEPHIFAMSTHDRVETTELWVDFDRVMQRNSPEYSDWAYKKGDDDASIRIMEFILNASDSGVLDLLDVGVALLVQVIPGFQKRHAYALRHWGVKFDAERALGEIDACLRDGGTIYRVADGTIINSTDDFTHEDIVVPALRTLGEPGFDNARKEFHAALDGYRNGAFDIAIGKANNAFESTMKIIAGNLRWAYDEKATAAGLIDVMVANQLIPPMRDGAMKTLAALLKSDLPPMRNKLPSVGHGAGEKALVIPETLATYAISAAAANIRLLIDSYKAKRKK